MDCDSVVDASAPAATGAFPVVTPFGAVMEFGSAERLDKVTSVEFARNNPHVIQRRRALLRSACIPQVSRVLDRMPPTIRDVTATRTSVGL
jgi:hypothetical protein